ncbi:MAG: hypothetical protein AB7D08_08020 [Bacteroidales bacterium]
MKKITASILTVMLTLSMVFSSSVFAAEKTSAWDSFLGLFSNDTATTEAASVGVQYKGHVQNIGDVDWVVGPEELGTEGQGLRLEAFYIELTNAPADMHIQYRVQVQNIGWMDWAEDGAIGGTTGKGLQVETVEIKLVDDNGDAYPGYSVQYRGHIQNKGDMPADAGWYADGEQLGTVGEFLRLEALEVQIVKLPADMTEYDAAVATANGLTAADYTTASWAALQTALTDNVVTEDNTQDEVDAATAAITAATDALVMTPRVVSVAAPNAKQLVVTFNMAMDKDTLLNDMGTAATNDNLLLATAVAITELDGQAAITEGSANAVLSADGKTLTITPQTTEAFNKRYTVTVGGQSAKQVKTADGQTLPQFTGDINVADTTRPVYEGTTAVDFQTVDVAFSEPVTTGAGTSFSYKLADGTVVTGATATAYSTTTAYDKFNKIKIDLSAAGVPANKDITVTMTGVLDFAGNVMTPNPVTFTVKKDTTATTKPVVSSVTVTGASTFDMLFSTALSVAPTVTAGTGPTATTSFVVDVDNPALYHATLAAPQSGLTTISYSAFTGINGVVGDAGSTVANFSADSTALAITSSSVQKIDGVEYLILNYNKYVTPVMTKTIAGTYVDNYVTKTMTPSLVTAATTGVGTDAFTLYNPVAGKSMSVKLDLTHLATAATYTVTLPTGLVTDLFANDSKEVTGFTFTRTSNDSTDAPEITSISKVVGNNNKVEVLFNKALDGASATTASNYVVEGATVSAAEILTSNTGLVTLTLADDSNTFTGAHAVTVSGVKSQSGDMMTTVTKTADLNENVRPTVAKAQIASTTVINVEFSEDVSNAIGTADTDFELYIGGVNSAKTASLEVVTVSSEKKTLTLTLDSALTAEDIAAGITIRPVTGNDIKDVVGNGSNIASSVTVVQ